MCVGRNFLRFRLILVYKNFGVLFVMAKVGIFFELCKGCEDFIFVLWIVGVRFVWGLLYSIFIVCL